MQTPSTDTDRTTARGNGKKQKLAEGEGAMRLDLVRPSTRG